MVSDSTIQAASRLAQQLAEQLARQNRHVVFAESCTAGLVSGLMASVSGISQWMYGSMVTYMDSAKINWLGIDPELIARHTSISIEVTRAMAAHILHRTPDADLALAVTGHLEPPAGEEPHAFVCLADRCVDGIVVSPVARKTLSGRTRVARQYQAAMAVLQQGFGHLNVVHRSDNEHAEWCEACERMGHASWIRWG